MADRQLADHPQTVPIYAAAAPAPPAPQPNKMFVGGISPDTTDDSLRNYFSNFGEVTDCVVMRDSGLTGPPRSRGFGFVTFADAASVENVLKNGPHVLDNRTIDPKLAVPRGQVHSEPRRQLDSFRQYNALQHQAAKTKKVFVGGINPDTTEEDLKTFFSQHGTVIDVVMPIDPATHRRRGFGFVTFEFEDVAERVCQVHFFEIKGKNVEVRKATPRSYPMDRIPQMDSYGAYNAAYTFPGYQHNLFAPTYGRPGMLAGLTYTGAYTQHHPGYNSGLYGGSRTQGGARVGSGRPPRGAPSVDSGLAASQGFGYDSRVPHHAGRGFGGSAGYSQPSYDFVSGVQGLSLEDPHSADIQLAPQ